MRSDLSPHDQAAAGDQKHRARPVQTGDQSWKVRVFLRDHILDNQAAGLVVRRLAIRNASPNITSENKSKVAIAEGNGNCVSIPG
jgi:hypothetical protein